MAEGIRVFFSYSHRDEQLRDELAKHLSILQWQGVIESWHDRKITAGDEWAGEIDENLNKADIILLLISSDFMASRYCYDIEMKRAVQRHDAGEARVIPIILRPVYWKGAPFGKLQALPKDAKAVTSWRTLDDAFVNIAEGIQAVVEAMNTGTPATHSTVKESVPVKKELPTYIVDQMHRGDFVTISDAIKAAKPGDRILVRPGWYQEGLIIDKPLEIVGDGERDEIVVQVSGKNVVRFETVRGRIANLTLRQAGGGNWFCVDITQGRLDLENCDITSQSGSCVGIHDGADPRVRNNRIRDGKDAGIVVYENGQGTLEDNEISGNALAGIAIRTSGNPVVRRNRIRDGKDAGIVVYENGQGTLEENEIFGNARAGIAIRTSGNPVVRRNRIRDGKDHGVYVYENGQGTLEGNEISGNALAGIGIRTGGDPVVRRNRIRDGKDAGIVVYENGQGTLEENEIFGNAKAGITIAMGGNSMVRHNYITGNTYEAIWVYENGGGTFEDNNLHNNDFGAWSIDASSLPNVIRRNNTPNE